MNLHPKILLKHPKCTVIYCTLLCIYCIFILAFGLPKCDASHLPRLNIICSNFRHKFPNESISCCILSQSSSLNTTPQTFVLLAGLLIRPSTFLTNHYCIFSNGGPSIDPHGSPGGHRHPVRKTILNLCILSSMSKTILI